MEFTAFAAALEPTYSIQTEIGRGMATVFLALDRKHGRHVAIKALAPELAASIEHSRFLREIRLAARLSHPHILPLLDSGEADGIPYYAMPFVEGETLRRRLEQEGRLPVADAVLIGTEVGDALEYAHAAGIVHRDVKPENVMMLSGHAVVMDFGVARAMYSAQGTEERTQAGIAVGTPAYMSPEQAMADPDLDGRSDEYSLALVIFELLAGAHPFAGRTHRDTVARRLAGAPPHIRDQAPEVSEAVDQVLWQALAIERNDRFESVAAFIAALRAAAAGQPVPAFVATTAPEPAASLAVLPFANLSRDEDNEYFSDGIAEEITTALSRLRNLKVAARSSAFAFKGQQGDVRRVAAALGVRHVLEGSVRRAGNRVRISTQLVDADSGFPVWSDRFDRDVTDLFAVQDDIAQAIVDVLQVHLLGGTSRPIADETTSSATAHDLYLRARFSLNRRTESSLSDAVSRLRQAVANDPSFVPAHVALGEALLLQGLYGSAPPLTVLLDARVAVNAALALDPSLADAQAMLGSLAAVLDWDWTGAGERFRRAVVLDPRSPAVRHRYAMDCLLPQRRFADALREMDEACRLDPLSLIMQASRGLVMHLAGDSDGAVAQLEGIRRTDPQFAMAAYFLGVAQRDAGDLDAAQRALEDAIRLGGTPEMTAGLAQTLAWQGRLDEARTHLEALSRLAESRVVSPVLRAQVHLSLGEQDTAIALLEQAADAHDPRVLHLATRRIYHRLAGEHRFERLRARIGVPAAGADLPRDPDR